MAAELANNVSNMIGSGRGLMFFEHAVNRQTRRRAVAPPAAILARLAMIKPIKNRKKNKPRFTATELEQLKELKQAIGSSEEFEPFKEYFIEFGNENFINSIKESAGDIIAENVDVDK